MNSGSILWVVPDTVNLPLFHGLQKCCLHLGRAPVDLVGKDDVGEDRPLFEPERAFTSCLMVDLGAGDVRGQEIGRKLDAAEIGFQVLRHRLDCSGLCQSRQAFHKQVAVGEQSNDQPVNYALLADDGLPACGP